MFDVPAEWLLPPAVRIDPKSRKKEEGEAADGADKAGVAELRGESKAKRASGISKPKARSKIGSGKRDLAGARFRYLNERLYTMDSAEAMRYFTENPLDFAKYHQGFAHQVSAWPQNPVDVFIARLLRDKLRPLNVVDMGCGEGRLGMALQDTHRVRSFDLVSTEKHVEVGDMCSLPQISTSSQDLVIFCLSLMNTNYVDALREARRILKEDGRLWIAEVVSRFPDGFKAFSSGISGMFRETSKDTRNNVFVILEYTAKPKPQLADGEIKPILTPCLYKKR